MKKGIILNLKKFKFLDYVNHNKIFLVLTLLYVTGIIISVTTLSSDNKIFDLSEKYLDNYITLHNSNLFFNKIFQRFLFYFIILLLYFLSGTSMFGVVVNPFFTLWQGILFGALSSKIYSLYGINGIAFNAIIIIPTTIIFVIICFFAARYAIEFSISFAKLTLPHSKSINLYFVFKKYCINYLILVTISFLCTLLEIVINLLFLKFFNF